VGLGVEQATEFAFGNRSAADDECSATAHGQDDGIHPAVV
jgi:hypothetical protein